MGAEQAANAACCGMQAANHERQINTEISEEVENRYKEVLANEKSKVQKLQQELDNARDEIRQLMKRYDTLITESSQKFSQLNQQYQNEYEQKRKLFAELQESSKRYHEMMRSQSELTAEYESKLQREKSQSMQLQQELDSNIKLGADQYTAETLNKYKATNQKLKEQLMEYEEYKLKALGLEHSNAALLRIQTELKNQITTLTKLIDEYNQKENDNRKRHDSQMSSLQTQILALRTEKEEVEGNKRLMAARLEKAEELHQEYVKTKKTEMSSLESENEALKQQLNRLNREMEELKQENQRLEAELLGSQDQQLVKENSILNHQVIIDSLNQQVDSLQSELEKYKMSEMETNQTAVVAEQEGSGSSASGMDPGPGVDGVEQMLFTNPFPVEMELMPDQNEENENKSDNAMEPVMFANPFSPQIDLQPTQDVEDQHETKETKEETDEEENDEAQKLQAEQEAKAAEEEAEQQRLREEEEAEKRRLQALEEEKQRNIDANFLSLNELHSKEKNISEKNVHHVLQQSRNVKNVEKLVMQTYASVDPYSMLDDDDDHDDTETELPAGIEEEDEDELEEEEDEYWKSMDDADKKRITIAQKEKKMDEDLKAMQQELALMQMNSAREMQQELHALKQHLSKNQLRVPDATSGSDLQTDDDFDEEHIAEEEQKKDEDDEAADIVGQLGQKRKSQSDTAESSPDVLPDEEDIVSQTNLFRYRSTAKWDVENLKKTQKEMRDHMVHMVQQMSSRSNVASQ